MSRFLRMLKDVCNVYRRGVGVPDDYDKASQDLTLLEEGVKCRLSVLGEGRETEQDKQVTTSTYKLFMAVGPLGSSGESIDRGHIVEIAGARYEVIDVKNPSNLDHHLEVFIERILT